MLRGSRAYAYAKTCGALGCKLPWPPRLRSEGVRNGFRIAGDHGEIGARGLVGLGRTLLPISQRTERDAEARRELLLRQPERTPNDLRARDALHPLEVRGRERLG